MSYPAARALGRWLGQAARAAIGPLVALKVYGRLTSNVKLGVAGLKAKPIARYELPSEIGHAIPNENIMLRNTRRS